VAALHGTAVVRLMAHRFNQSPIPEVTIDSSEASAITAAQS
jgi:hypothetical protein